MVTASPPIVQFFVSGHCQTKGSLHIRHRWGPMLSGKPMCSLGLSDSSGPRLAEWRALVATAAKRAMGQRTPFDGPVKVTMTFWFERPKSHTKEQRRSPYVAVVRRYDPEKLARAVNDALSDAAVWTDDGLNAELHVYKFYADGPRERPGVSVTLEPLS